jgi:hypothetical protein
MLESGDSIRGWLIGRRRWQTRTRDQVVRDLRAELAGAVKG